MTAPSTASENAIEVRSLAKRYPKAPANAVSDLSFTVRRGEIFGLLGPNGAGKTTTIGVLMTRVRPSGGSALVMGVNVTRDPIGVKQRIAVVPQTSNLDQSLKVRDILLFHAAYHSVPRQVREARADALLAELGLADRANDRVSRYSGGMNQRLMIARALMHSPDILFLDEPTNNLDPQSRLFLWERIRDLNAKGLTILLTTHDMEEADQLCERIAIMDYGKILVNDSSEQLKKIIPGGTVLEVRVYVPELVAAGPARSDRSASARLLSALQALPGVTKIDELAKDPQTPVVPDRSLGGRWAGRSGARRQVGPAGGSWTGLNGGQAQALEPGVTSFRLYAEDATLLVAGANQTILAAGAELRDLHVKYPSLEDVFIYLTGRNLR
jgi:ABC-2 type transport system ATP-binding protein